MVRYNALFMPRVPRNVRGGHFQEAPVKRIKKHWIPAFAGTTSTKNDKELLFFFSRLSFCRVNGFQETYGKSPLTPLFQRGGHAWETNLFPPLKKGGRGDLSLKQNSGIKLLPFFSRQSVCRAHSWVPAFAGTTNLKLLALG